MIFEVLYDMKKLSPLLLSLLFATNFSAQSQTKLIFDTTANAKQFNNSRYYAKTDFSFIDTIELWNYRLDTTYKPKQLELARPIGQLIFWRTRPIDDKVSKKLYNRDWTPYIVFEIYNLADSNFCYEKSNRRRLLSSCVPPNVGGDIIFLDRFIFVNSHVCLSCERYDTKVDYCRPVINYVFSNVDKTKITNLKSLVQQFVIKEGKLEHAPRS